jgi:class 3 adenylate cyclase
MSVGVHSGSFHFFSVGARHRELLVTGPAATCTAHMEAAAEAGEIVVSAEIARLLGRRTVGASRVGGFLVAAAPHVAAPPPPSQEPASQEPAGQAGRPSLSLPAQLRAYLLAAPRRQGDSAVTHR